LAQPFSQVDGMNQLVQPIPQAEEPEQGLGGFMHPTYEHQFLGSFPNQEEVEGQRL
jgi:hypothetical protein